MATKFKTPKHVPASATVSAAQAQKKNIDDELGFSSTYRSDVEYATGVHSIAFGPCMS